MLVILTYDDLRVGAEKVGEEKNVGVKEVLC